MAQPQGNANAAQLVRDAALQERSRDSWRRFDLESGTGGREGEGEEDGSVESRGRREKWSTTSK